MMKGHTVHVWKGYMKGLQHRSKDVTLTASGEHVHACDNLFFCIRVCERGREF